MSYNYYSTLQDLYKFFPLHTTLTFAEEKTTTYSCEKLNLRASALSVWWYSVGWNAGRLWVLNKWKESVYKKKSSNDKRRKICQRLSYVLFHWFDQSNHINECVRPHDWPIDQFFAGFITRLPLCMTETSVRFFHEFF